MTTILTEHFTKALFMMLDETFDNVHGAYLDKNTSLFETLAGISAEQASIPAGRECATLAAQVKHVAFYLDVVENSVHNPDSPGADWDEIWRTVSTVTAEEWQSIQDELRASYDRIKVLIQSTPSWSSEREIGGAIAVIAHTAYHLAEIRQALCILKKIKTIVREMRGIPYFLLKEYLQELGGTLTTENEVHGEGWTVRLEKMEPFRLGSLSVGQTRLTMEIREDVYDDFMARFEMKTLRAGA